MARGIAIYSNILSVFSEVRAMQDTRFFDHIPARIYQKAFAYRDVEKECKFLLKAAALASARNPVKFLEIASGPSEHAIWFGAKDGFNSHALDLSCEMIELAENAAKAASSRVSFHKRDMVDFDLPEGNFDLAYCLIDSISYITSQSGFLQHLTSVRKVLQTGGAYIIETLHPKTILNGKDTTITEWTTDLGDEGSLTIRFGSNTDALDPITQVRPIEVHAVEDHPLRGKTVFTSVMDMKTYLFQELVALVGQSDFVISGVYGDFDQNVVFDNSRESWRCILVLQAK